MNYLDQDIVNRLRYIKVELYLHLGDVSFDFLGVSKKKKSIRETAHQKVGITNKLSGGRPLPDQPRAFLGKIFAGELDQVVVRLGQVLTK